MQHNAVTGIARVRARRSLGKELALQSGDALLVVDMQRDFLPGGSCAVPRADEIIAPINDYLAAFDERELPIFLSRDWHPAGHLSFKRYGGNLPAHCVQETSGAEWAEDLQIPSSARVISKASERDQSAYSVFDGTPLHVILKTAHVQRLFVAGVAIEYGIHGSVLSARDHGLDVVVLLDAVRGVNRERGDESRALREMMECGATFFEPKHGPMTHARVVPGSRRVIHPIERYGFGIQLTLPFAEAVARVVQALQDEGFGVVSDIDVAATLGSKLGVHVWPYRILGACDPTLAHRAIEAQPSIGMLLPCNVVVRQDERAVVHIEAMDPGVLSKLTEQTEIAKIAREVRRRLRKAIHRI